MSGASGRPLVSLIVVTYQSAELMPSFFEALERTRYPNYEVVVVDNASGDGVAEVVAQLRPDARVICNRQNVGFGRACNQGAQAAQGDVLVFMNADVLTTPDWLDILVARLAAQPDVAVLCPTTLYPGQMRPKPTTAFMETAAVPGCAMVMPRWAWVALNGFDEQIFLYWEDTELCWRAWLHGWRVLVDLEAEVYHERGGSGGGRRWDAEQMKNGIYTHLKLLRWRMVVPFLLGSAVKTVAKRVLRGQQGLAEPWRWNWRHLGSTLAQRRALVRQIAPAKLERLIRQHQREQRSQRAARALQRSAAS